jgi:hypothetical protein
VILSPFIPTTLSMLSFSKLLDFFRESGIDRNKLLVVFSMVEKKKKIHQDILSSFSGKKGILKTCIPYVTDIEQMGLFRQPVPVYEAKTGQVYAELWREVEQYLQPVLNERG